MQYALLALDTKPPLLLDISDQEYVELKVASDSLSEALFIEEKFDIIVGNTFELEVEMLRCTEKFLMFSDTSFTLEKLVLNRRIVNLLTACRLYFDHTGHHLSTLLGKNSDEFNDIRRRASEQYDNCFGYRFMEAMRNFVQHRGYPIGELSPSSGLANRSVEVDHSPSRGQPVRYDITPVVSVADLKKDGTFKRAILNEIERMDPPAVNLKLAIREYVEGISRIHGVTRRHLEDKISVWENTLKVAAGRIERTLGFPVEERQVAVVYDDQGLSTEAIDIPGDVSRDMRLFCEKNALFPQEELSRAFVTSEATMARADVEQTGLMYIDLILMDALKVRKTQ
jgi:hypothetical protein